MIARIEEVDVAGLSYRRDNVVSIYLNKPVSTPMRSSHEVRGE